MDEQDLALNQSVGEQANLDTPPVSEPEAVGEVEEPQVDPTGETEVTTTETTGEPRRGAQERIRELNRKAKEAEERAKSLEEKLAELTNPVGFQAPSVPQFSPQEPLVAPGEEIDATELNRRIADREHRLLQMADARAELRQRQSEAVNRINSESSEVVRAYPELDPDSENFNRELSDTVTEATLAYIKANPYSASVKQFVAKLMKPYKGAVAREVGQASENIAKQVSQAALRPTPIRKQEKSASEKSLEELERELGIVHS